MKDGLKEAYHREIVRILAENPRVERVVLFGSRARGDYRPESDIDLALFGGKLTTRDLADLQARLEETVIPQRVDLLLASMMEDPELRLQIEREGQCWFRREPNAAAQVQDYAI